MFTRAPGVGPKVALRLVNELKDKAPAASIQAAAIAASASAGAGAKGEGASAVVEAVSALVNLGYPPIQANAAVSAALPKAGDPPRTENLIRLALKELAR